MDEDSDDESETEVDGEPLYEKRFPGAGKVFGKGSDILTSITESDEFRVQRKTNLYFPFSCKMEWEVAKWLSTLNVSISQADAFFKLEYVRCSLLYLPRTTIKYYPSRFV